MNTQFRDLVDLGYFQTKARAEVYAERARLFGADPQALAGQGDYEKAIMANCSRAKGVDTAAAHGVECYEADEQMDRAVELLACGDFNGAIEHLQYAVGHYRKTREARADDLADALWNLGYAQVHTGRFGLGLENLFRTLMVLQKRGRIRDWIRCSITTAVAKSRSGSAAMSSALMQELMSSCIRYRLPEETVVLTVLFARALIHNRQAVVASDLLERAQPLATRLGPGATRELVWLQAQVPRDFAQTATAARGTVGAVDVVAATTARQ